MTTNTTLIPPYGGGMIDLMIGPQEYDRMFVYAAGLRGVRLGRRQVCDLEMLTVGGFSPLNGFMSKADLESVLDTMRLADGTLFPVPVTLSIDDVEGMNIGDDVALRDVRNEILAVMSLEDVFEWDREKFAACLLGTTDTRHPLAAEMQSWGRFCIAGDIRVIKLPEYHDFQELRLTPLAARERLAMLGRANVVAFQTRNPMHRAHEIMTQRAIEMTGGTLLLHPAVGMTKDGDIDYFTRVRTYKAATELCYPQNRVLLSLVPLAMRMAGPREAVWHAIIRRNYGASHFIVGRDHASPGNDGRGLPFYPPYAAQELAQDFSDEIGVKILSFNELAYDPESGDYVEFGVRESGKKVIALSGTQMREEYLEKGRNLPEWYARKEITDILSDAHPPPHRRGVCIWFTGLSGSGKSTTAEIVASLLLEEGRRSTLLDGDVVRTHLSQGLGFSRSDRNTNVARIGFVASEIVRHGGIAICAAISPYRESRNQVRLMFGNGHFVEVFVSTPFDVCEHRDTKGMYAKARRGEITNFTGIDDEYETPQAAELTIETRDSTARENAVTIIEYLRSQGFLLTPSQKKID